MGKESQAISESISYPQEASFLQPVEDLVLGAMDHRERAVGYDDPRMSNDHLVRKVEDHRSGPEASANRTESEWSTRDTVLSHGVPTPSSGTPTSSSRSPAPKNLNSRTGKHSFPPVTLRAIAAEQTGIVLVQCGYV